MLDPLFLVNHTSTVALVVVVVVILLGSIRICQEYQRAVVFRFGREVGMRGPGLFLKMPLIERAVIVDVRTATRQLETQETVTRDGVAVKVNAVVWYQVVDPVKALIQVMDVNDAVTRAAETALRDTVGQNELDGLLKDRLSANSALKELLSAAVNKWGIDVTAVELKDLDIPDTLQRAIAREAEAIREKRARIIKAEGEKEAATKLNEAAAIMGESGVALELRRLQALTEIGAENNSVIIIAMPGEVGSNGTAAAITRALSTLKNAS